MDSPTHGSNRKRPAPSDLTNGTSKISPGKKERQKLAAGIESTSRKRQRTDPSLLNGHVDSGPINHLSVDEPARDARDQATPPNTLSQNRPASPYTLNPPVDFDGLSWPSR